jgi:glutathione S-transferase
MKPYTAKAPNAFRLHVFLAEKGGKPPIEPADILAGETRTPTFRAINLVGEASALELNDGAPHRVPGDLPLSRSDPS